MILHFDFSTGASGDKILGSLIEVCEGLGVASFDDVVSLASSLVPGVQLERKALQQGGINATGLSVFEAAPPHRHWTDIRQTIEAAGRSGLLSEGALRLSLEAFGAIAEAEAAVHGVDIEHVHFHEVGAADSIIDICCSSFLLDRLAPIFVYATPLALGFGTFVCSHGEMPVPAPATARIIESLPVYAGAHEGELTTPTGAALAKAFVGDWQQLPYCKPVACGYGAGSRTIAGASNVVRALAAEPCDETGFDEPLEKRLVDTPPEPVAHYSPEGEGDNPGRPCEPFEASAFAASGFMVEGCVLLETNIDHLSPEALGFACEELLDLDVMDVWQESITMKKGRLAVRLNVLTTPLRARDIAEAIIRLTGSLGVRRSYVERVIALREVEYEATPYGATRFKTAFVAAQGGTVRLRRPEYEDVARIAREQGLDFNKLYAELNG